MRSTAMIVEALDLLLRRVRLRHDRALESRAWPLPAGAPGRAAPAAPRRPGRLRRTRRSLRGSGLSRSEELIASSTARSAAGSLMRTPPTALTNTSWSHAGDAGMAVQHREQHREAVALEADRQPPRARRLRGVDQRLDLDQQRPRAFQRRPARTSPAPARRAATGRSRDGLATPFRPFSVIANTPISLTAPKRFLIARTRRKLECVSPSKYSTVSTMCSSTRGPASAPSLVTWPTRTMRGAALLGEARELRRAFAHLRDRAGRRGERVGVDGLDRIDHRDLRAASASSVARIFSSWISASSAHRARVAAPSRRARSATCAPDSSPVT